MRTKAPPLDVAPTVLVEPAGAVCAHLPDAFGDRPHAETAPASQQSCRRRVHLLTPTLTLTRSNGSLPLPLRLWWQRRSVNSLQPSHFAMVKQRDALTCTLTLTLTCTLTRTLTRTLALTRICVATLTEPASRAKSHPKATGVRYVEPTAVKCCSLLVQALTCSYTSSTPGAPADMSAHAYSIGPLASRFNPHHVTLTLTCDHHL